MMKASAQKAASRAPVFALSVAAIGVLALVYIFIKNFDLIEVTFQPILQ